MVTLAILAVTVHGAWLLLVIFGAIWTRRRPLWSALHVLALLWGIAVEVGPWPCPLTLMEEYFETRAGQAAYHGSYMLHYLEAAVYPEGVSEWIVVTIAVAVCLLNLGVYLWRFWVWRSRSERAHSGRGD
jgi:hypothetical protein